MMYGIQQNSPYTNYQLKNNSSNIMFKANPTKLLTKNPTIQKTAAITSSAAFFAMIANIFSTKNNASKSITNGKEIAAKANQIMTYIESLPEYKASNFKHVTAGMSSQKRQFGPIVMDDGTRATLDFKVMDYSDGNALIEKVLKIEDENIEWYATSRMDKSSTNRYQVDKELEQELNNKGKTKWLYFYDRNTRESFDSKGKFLSPKNLSNLVYGM